MKNVLIVSDSHGRSAYLEEVIKKSGPLDLVIHLGDTRGEEMRLQKMLSCPLEMVAGNNDYGTGKPYDKIIELENYRILLTHGHRYGVDYNTDLLVKKARQQECQIALYGHTHVPEIQHYPDLIVANPGSISLPRQHGRKPSYIRMEIDKDGEVHFTINYEELRSGLGWDF